MKREGDEKGTAEQSEAKNHPVNGFLVPRIWRRHCPSAAGRVPLSPPPKKPRVSGLFAYFGFAMPAKSYKTISHEISHGISL